MKKNSLKIEKYIKAITVKRAIQKWFIFNLALLIFVPLSFAQEMVTSEIKKVTLYSNQALVKREAIVKVNKGLNDLFLELEAYNVDKDSISAKVIGEGEILSIQSKDVYLKGSHQENINALEQKIKELKVSKRTLMDKKYMLEKKELFLDSLIDLSHPQFPQDKKIFLKIAELKEILDFIASSFQSIHEEKRSLDLRIEDIDKEIKTFEKEWAFLKVTQKKEKKVIQILFDSEKDQAIKIEVSYLAQDAYWKPLYKVSIPSTLKEANLIMFSKIQQKTGEDWKNITLSISNVIPLKGVNLPSPASWLLNIQSPRQKPVRQGKWFSFMEEEKDPSVGDMKGLPDSEDSYEEETTFAYAQKEEALFSFEYQIPQQIDIDSKDKEKILPIFKKKLKGEFFYYTVSRTNTLTFLVFKANADKELLSGPLNVYLDNRFIGKTLLHEKKAGEEIYLNLGADREVKVRRGKIKDKFIETSIGKIETNTIIKELGFKITLENQKDKPIKLKVFDSIPTSSSDIVEIKDINIEPEPIERNYQDQDGVLLWEFVLKPKEKQEITINFVISYPKDLQLIGL
jgi:uncharacterized protein (TIGR02231 family)